MDILEIKVSRRNREELLEARLLIDEALHDLVTDKYLIGSEASLKSFIEDKPEYQHISPKKAHRELYLGVLRLWTKAWLSKTFSERLKEQNRDWTDGFLLEELLIEGFRLPIKKPSESKTAHMLWAYLAQFGIFPEDKTSRISKIKPD